LIRGKSMKGAAGVEKIVQVLSYAAPQYQPGEVKFWANGELLDMREDSTLPERCIKCNAQAVGEPVSIHVEWQDPNFREEFSELRWIPYLRIIWLISRSIEQRRHRQSARVRIPLCLRHRRIRHLGRWAASTTAAVAVGVGFLAWHWENAVLALISGAMLFAALLVGNFWPNVVVPVRIDHGMVTLRGCGPSFLASLPVGKAPGTPTAAASTDLAAATLRLSQRRRYTES
jgi:hypothetical protein